MGYYRGMGDYYRGAGDPGALTLLKRVGSGIGQAVGKVARSGVGRTALGATGFGGAIAGAVGTRLAARAPKIRIRPTKILPGGDPFLSFDRPKRRRINPTNPKALRRAIRRVDGFVALSRRVLSQAGFQVSRTRRAKTTKRKS